MRCDHGIYALTLGVILIAELSTGHPALAQGQGLTLHVDLQNLFLFRNDADFDRTPPKYNENGQTVGAFATFLRPSIAWNIQDNLRLYYELEIGLNYWSMQNPDVQDYAAPDIFVMKHREIWGAGELLGGDLFFKVGYQRFLDPTGLFVNHWIGMAQAGWSWDAGERLGIFVGEIPDQLDEGINVLDNNFKRDILLSGAFLDLALSDEVKLNAALFYLYDNHLVDQARWLLAPSAHLEVTFDPDVLVASLDLIFQAGESQNAVQGGGWQRSLSWAAQGHLDWRISDWQLTLNVLGLSPDDAYQGNRTSYAFQYSGKCKSSTLMLTEDKIRDWYDNLDERLSTYRGGFFTNRAGLMVADLKIAWTLDEVFSPALVVAAATVLKPANALDNSFVGMEADLILPFKILEGLTATVAGGVLVPGAAAAALVNRIDLSATDPILMAEASLSFHY
jgi:hypothetical protein